MSMPKRIIALVYPELSYKIIGAAFQIHNEIGVGHKEKFYQKALAVAFRDVGIKFREQVHCPLLFRGEKVGRYFLDFLVEDKVVVELKSGEKFLRQNINQVYSYLKTNNLPLGILVNFTKEGVKFKRIVNVS